MEFSDQTPNCYDWQKCDVNHSNTNDEIFGPLPELEVELVASIGNHWSWRLLMQEEIGHGCYENNTKMFTVMAIIQTSEVSKKSKIRMRLDKKEHKKKG